MRLPNRQIMWRTGGEGETTAVLTQRLSALPDERLDGCALPTYRTFHPGGTREQSGRVAGKSTDSGEGSGQAANCRGETGDLCWTEASIRCLSRPLRRPRDNSGDRLLNSRIPFDTRTYLCDLDVMKGAEFLRRAKKVAERTGREYRSWPLGAKAVTAASTLTVPSRP